MESKEMMIQRHHNFRLGIYLCISLVAAAGCVSKGRTPPRSEIMAEAISKGTPLPSLDMERDAFFKPEEENKTRLLTLLKGRATENVDSDGSYLIGPGDDIQVAVFDVPELNTTVKVLQDGTIGLPLVGKVQAGGRSEFELITDLSKRLATFVRNPQISVTISHYGSQKVGVLGAVRKPGSYSLKKGQNSVLELIGTAGGLSDKAGNFLNFIPNDVMARSRSVDDVEARARLALEGSTSSVSREKGVELYLDQVLGTNGGIPLDIPVLGGDMIIIPEAGKVMVEGEVEKTGPVELGQQMTLLGSLAAAGGITYAAKVDEVEIVRDIGNDQKAHLIVNLEELARGEGRDVRLRNGDIVRVPSDAGKRLTQDTFEGITKIFNVGVGGSVPIH